MQTLLPFTTGNSNFQYIASNFAITLLIMSIDVCKVQTNVTPNSVIKYCTSLFCIFLLLLSTARQKPDIYRRFLKGQHMYAEMPNIQSLPYLHIASCQQIKATMSMCVHAWVPVMFQYFIQQRQTKALDQCTALSHMKEEFKACTCF